MDASRLLLIFMVISTSEYSGTAKATCVNYGVESFYLLKGEAFYFVPYIYDNDPLPPDEEFTWYKNNYNISSNEKDRIHYHGRRLFMLNLLPEDSGLYTARHTSPSGNCSNYDVNIKVFNSSHKNNKTFFYGEIKNSDVNKNVPCPDNVKKTCVVFKGNFTWYKNFTALQDEHEMNLWVKKATKSDEGIYTCICTWTHNDKMYNSSGSRWLEGIEQVAHRYVQILSPTNKDLIADEGSEVKLNCSVFCGTKTKHCNATWTINGKLADKIDGYNQTISIVTENPSQNTISTAILTIEKVSAEDFHTAFKCNAYGFYSYNSTTLCLKRRESIIPLVIGKLFVLCVCVFAAVLVKCFIIDLTLLFRPYIPVSSYNKDVRMFDAYVVYQTQNVDTVTEDTLSRFVTDILPSVLEDKCGYRLFIHGRDDLPGEDYLELVEERMKQSRRLMIMLTLGSEPQSEITETTPASPQTSEIGGFDWQVGFHHALMQTGMKVILIQFGDAGPHGYTHLSPSLQHLIRKNPPIKWPEGSRGATAWNSRFWKRVRYLMPALPVRKCPQSSVV